MEAFAIGDLHFDGPLSRLIPNHELVIVNELNKVAEAARRKGVQNLFLLGDICHTPRMSYESNLAFLGWLQSLSHDFTVHCILGNHDMFSTQPEAGHSLQLLEMMNLRHVYVYTKPTKKKIDGALVNFMPWPAQKFRKGMLNVAHIERKGSMSDSGVRFKGKEMPDDNCYCVIGHLHTQQTVRRAYYPGSLLQTTFGEQEKRYYAHITSDGNEFDIQYVRHKPSIVLRTIVVNKKSDLRELPSDPNILIRLIIADGLDISKAQLSKYPNVVKVRGFSSKEDLQQVVTEDLAEGLDIKIKTKDFLLKYLSLQNVDHSMRKDALRVWKDIVWSRK